MTQPRRSRLSQSSGSIETGSAISIIVANAASCFLSQNSSSAQMPCPNRSRSVRMGAELKSKNQIRCARAMPVIAPPAALTRITSPVEIASNGAIRHRLNRDSRVFRPVRTKDRNGSVKTAKCRPISFWAANVASRYPPQNEWSRTRSSSAGSSTATDESTSARPDPESVILQPRSRQSDEAGRQVVKYTRAPAL